MIKNHVLLERADNLMGTATEIENILTEKVLQSIMASIPEDWLTDNSSPMTPNERRIAYIEFLMTKLSKIDLLAKEAADAQ